MNDMARQRVDKATGWTEAEIRTAGGWKQGLGYWLYKAPYKNTDRRFVRTPPAGVKIEMDMKSAVATMQRLTALNEDDDSELIEEETDENDEEGQGESYAGEPGEDALS